MNRRHVYLSLIAAIACTFLHSAIIAHPSPIQGYFSVTVNDCYKWRDDGKPGREAVLTWHGGEIGKGTVEVISRKGHETYSIIPASDSTCRVLLHPEIGVDRQDTVIFRLSRNGDASVRDVIIHPMRHWTVYIYPHSHVDIGYTNTQDNVEYIHKKNLDVAMDLAEKTRNYPEDSRFRWNPEVIWPVERYLHSEPEEKCQKLLAAIKRGDISLDAGYVNTNTSASSDEELLEFFSFGQEISKLTGRPIETLVQTDVPGMSWGIVAAASQVGVKYVLSLFNGHGRIGHSYMFSFHPFWWVGPDGKSKVLFLQPGSYAPGANIKGRYFWPQMAGQLDRNKLLSVVKTENPRENFIDPYLKEMLPQLEADKDYPYDIFPMTWCMADNTPIDADLPDAVRSWNEEYAYPHLKICTGPELMHAFEDKWGDSIPVLSGDYTETWTDGLGSSAAKTGESREVKERLVQAEILWSMLNPRQGEPSELVREAWRNIILSTEHTWAFMDPNRQPLQNEILGVKWNYFDTAKKLTDQFMNMSISEIEDPSSDWITVFNTDSWERTSLVRIHDADPQKYNAVHDSDGNEIACQRLSNGDLAFIAENVPALGCRSFLLSGGEKPGNDMEKQSNASLDNGIVRVSLDSLTGDIYSILFDGEEFVNPVDQAGINSFRYLHGDDSPGRATRPTNIRISIGEHGPLVNSLIVESDAEGCNSLRREIILTKGSPIVECHDIIDKKSVVEKEGIHFGFAFNIPNPVIRANIPWGVMEVEKDQLTAANRNWITMQRWLDVSNGDKGVAWCPINACSFEVGDITANIIGPSYQSPRWIEKIKPSSTIYSWALNNHWYTNFPLSQEGLISFRYSLLPHSENFDPVASSRFGYEQFRPMIAVRTKKNFNLDKRLEISENDQVLLSNYKTINDGKTSMLRFLSISSEEQTITVSVKGRKPASVLCKHNGETTKLSKNDIVATIPPKGIVTLNINWK